MPKHSGTPYMQANPSAPLDGRRILLPLRPIRKNKIKKLSFPVHDRHNIRLRQSSNKDFVCSQMDDLHICESNIFYSMSYHQDHFHVRNRCHDTRACPFHIIQFRPIFSQIDFVSLVVSNFSIILQDGCIRLIIVMFGYTPMQN
jgi:hypothetical protein